MNNDLISREELKIELTKQIAYFGERANTQSDENKKNAYSRCKDGLTLARQTVDNAPTVNVTALCPVDFPTIDDPYPCCSYKRPQGKWKFIQGATTQGSLKCPFCDYRDYHKTNSNFCPNCGADMRGDNNGKEETT